MKWYNPVNRLPRVRWLKSNRKDEKVFVERELILQVKYDDSIQFLFGILDMSDARGYEWKAWVPTSNNEWTYISLDCPLAWAYAPRAIKRNTKKRFKRQNIVKK